MPNTMAVYGIKGDKAYVIDYIAGSKATYFNYLPIAQKMIDSFQIINAKTTTPTIATTASSSAIQTNPNNKNATAKTTTLSHVHLLLPQHQTNHLLVVPHTMELLN